MFHQPYPTGHLGGREAIRIGDQAAAARIMVAQTPAQNGQRTDGQDNGNLLQRFDGPHPRLRFHGRSLAGGRCGPLIDKLGRAIGFANSAKLHKGSPRFMT